MLREPCVLLDTCDTIRGCVAVADIQSMEVK